MSEPMTTADVPEGLVDAAEQALAAATQASPEDELATRDAIRIMLAVVLPMDARRLSIRLGRLITSCPDHKAPHYGRDCTACARFTALIGARRVIEGIDGTAAALTQLTPVGADAGGDRG